MKKDYEMMTTEELRAELKNKYALYDQLVGTLYPPIVAEDIIEITRKLGGRPYEAR